MRKRTSKKRQLIHVQGRRAEAFRQLTAGIPPERTLIAPLDIGKNIHWAAFHTRDGLLLWTGPSNPAIQSQKLRPDTRENTGACSPC